MIHNMNEKSFFFLCGLGVMKVLMKSGFLLAKMLVLFSVKNALSSPSQTCGSRENHSAEEVHQEIMMMNRVGRAGLQSKTLDLRRSQRLWVCSPLTLLHLQPDLSGIQHVPPWP